VNAARPRRALILLAAVSGLLLAACGPRATDRIIIGSKNFTEQAVLGELVAQQLERRTDLSVERRFFLAGTLICHQSILSDRIDLYVEYTGTALTAILNEPPGEDAQKVLEHTRRLYAERFDLEMLDPLGFNNTFAVVMRREDAQRLGVRTISDATPHAPGWRNGFGYEFLERPDGYPGLARTYGLEFSDAPRIMDLGLVYRTLRDGKIDLAVGNSTDGLIDALDLVILEDDQGYFPPYEAVPVVRRDTLERHPGIGEALAELAHSLDEAEMRRLNHAVDGEHRDAKQVVREFLDAL
jgi:glycine betaine/choline ABC-type transport system substrate-binding protein